MSAGGFYLDLAEQGDDWRQEGEAGGSGGDEAAWQTGNGWQTGVKMMRQRGRQGMAGRPE